MNSKDSKSLVQLFLDHAVLSNIYRITLVDGGKDTISYTSLLDMNAVHQRFGTYGHVYPHMLVTCPLRWHSMLIACFKLDAQHLLNLNSYTNKQLDVRSVISLLNDCHQQPSKEVLQQLMSAQCVGVDQISAIGASHIDPQADCTFQQVQLHVQELLNEQYQTVIAGKPVRLRSSQPAPTGHSVDDKTSETDRLAAMIAELQAEYVNTNLVWTTHEGAGAPSTSKQAKPTVEGPRSVAKQVSHWCTQLPGSATQSNEFAA